MPTGWSSYAKRMGGLVPGRLQRAAVALLAPPTATPGRYTPTDQVLAYLDSLG